MLEVPVTTRQNYAPALDAAHRRVRNGIMGKLLRRVAGSPQTWLRPTGRNLNAMLALIDSTCGRRAPVLEFMLHSSELMPGGSPSFRSPDDIETLYSHMERLFTRAADRGAVGKTLGEFRSEWAARGARPRE
jgi:hypothetical protein